MAAHVSRARSASSLLFATLIALALLPGLSTAQELPPAQAQDLVAPVFGRDFSAVQQFPTPVAYDFENRYYLFYFPADSSQRLFAAVHVTNGFETEAQRLNDLARFAYLYDVTHNQLKRQRADLDALRTALDALRTKTESVQRAESGVRAQVEQQSPSVDLSGVSTRLALLAERNAGFADAVSEAYVYRGQFDRDPSLHAFDSFLDAYNASLDAARAAFDAADAYGVALSTTANDVLQDPSLSSTQKQAIVTALQGLSVSGTYEAYRSQSFEPGVRDFALFASRADAWAAQSVDGMLYRKARADALALQSSLASIVPLMLARKAEYARCAVRLDDLQAAWRRAEAELAKDTIAGYQAASVAFTQANAAQADANERYERCLAAPPLQQTPDGVPLWVWSGLLVLIGAGFYVLYKRAKAEKEAMGEA